MNYSVTYIGAIVFLASKLFEYTGVPVATADIETTITTVTALIGAVMVLYGRYRAGGVSAFGFKK